MHHGSLSSHRPSSSIIAVQSHRLSSEAKAPERKAPDASIGLPGQLHDDRYFVEGRISIELPQGHLEPTKVIVRYKDGIQASSSSKAKQHSTSQTRRERCSAMVEEAELSINAKPTEYQLIKLMKSSQLQSCPSRPSLQDDRGLGSLVVLASTHFREQEALTLLTTEEAHQKYLASAESDAVAWASEAQTTSVSDFDTQQQPNGDPYSLNQAPSRLNLPLSIDRTLALPRGTSSALISSGEDSKNRKSPPFTGASRMQTENLASLAYGAQQLQNPLIHAAQETGLGAVKSARLAAQDNLCWGNTYANQASIFQNNNILIGPRHYGLNHQRCSVTPKIYPWSSQSLQAVNLQKNSGGPARTTAASFLTEISCDALLMAEGLSSSSNESSARQKLELSDDGLCGKENPKLKRKVVLAESIQSLEVKKKLPRSALVQVEWGVPLNQLPFSSETSLFCVPKTDKYEIYKYKNPKTGRYLKLLKCGFDHCDRVFTKWHNFYDHLRFHTKERPYQCPYKQQLDCDFAFAQKSNLNKHIIAHQAKHPGIQPDSACQSERLLGKRKRPF